MTPRRPAIHGLFRAPDDSSAPYRAYVDADDQRLSDNSAQPGSGSASNVPR